MARDWWYGFHGRFFLRENFKQREREKNAKKTPQTTLWVKESNYKLDYKMWLYASLLSPPPPISLPPSHLFLRFLRSPILTKLFFAVHILPQILLSHFETHLQHRNTSSKRGREKERNKAKNKEESKSTQKSPLTSSENIVTNSMKDSFFWH